jgi:diacylglycerol kinase family enzyme
MPGRRPSQRDWKPVEAPGRPVLFVNPASGGGKASRADLAGQARKRGVEPVVLESGNDLETLVREAVADGADALGMAGGDGSLATVAAAASTHGLPFVCVPAGTRNHFARDLGVARHDLVGALDAFTDGLERSIDLGDVNGRPFINNVSLGIYGDAVQQAGYREAKVRTLVQTAEEVVGPSAPPPSTLHVVDDLGRDHTRPAVILVSNNPYALDLPPLVGTRPALDSGRLGIIVLDAPPDPRHAPGRAWTAPSVELIAGEPVAAGLDGEAITLEPSLRFRILPAALRVRISSRHPGVSPSGRLPLRAARRSGRETV